MLPATLTALSIECAPDWGARPGWRVGADREPAPPVELAGWGQRTDRQTAAVPRRYWGTSAARRTYVPPLPAADGLLFLTCKRFP